MNAHHMIDTAQGRIMATDKAGEPGRPALVFLHGAGFTHRVFDQQFRSDTLSDCRRIAIDFPGHGASDRPKDPAATYSFGGLATGVRAVLTALDVENCVLVGWSLGGHVALDMLDDEPRVAGALITGAPPLAASPLTSLRALHFSRDALLGSKARFSQADAVRFARLCLGDHVPADQLEALLSVDPQARPMLARSVFFGQNRDQRVLALGARKPLFIMQGADDPLIRASHVAALIGAPEYHGQGRIVNGVGHAPFVQAQDRFDAMLAGFIDDVAAAGPVPADRRVA